MRTQSPGFNSMGGPRWVGMGVGPHPDWDRVLFLCDECGRYTESLPDHHARGRCVNRPHRTSAA